MTVDETSPAVAFLDRDGRTEAILLSSRNDVRQRLLACFCTGVSDRYAHLTDDLKEMMFPPMSALSLPIKPRREADPTGMTTDLSVFGFNVLLASTREYFQCKTECWSGQKETVKAEHYQTAQYSPHTQWCETITLERELSAQCKQDRSLQ